LFILIKISENAETRIKTLEQQFMSNTALNNYLFIFTRELDYYKTTGTLLLYKFIYQTTFIYSSSCFVLLKFAENK